MCLIRDEGDGSFQCPVRAAPLNAVFITQRKVKAEELNLIIRSLTQLKRREPSGPGGLFTAAHLKTTSRRFNAVAFRKEHL
jgi:hypothetical protein